MASKKLLPINYPPSINKRGFTIVELLVVIIVIGILAAISLVAYSGVSSRATIASLTSDLDNASKQLKMFQIEKSNFPTTISSDCAAQPDTATNKCLKSSNGATYEYYVDNTANNQVYCITITKNNYTYSIGNNGIIVPTAYCPVLYLDAGNKDSYPGAGTTWKDLSGYGNNGTLNGGVSYSSANGGVFSFDGVDDYVLVTDNDTLDLNDNFTVSTWINPNLQTSYGVIHKGDGSIKGAGLAYGWDGNGFMFISWNGANSPYRVKYADDIANWHNLVGVVNNGMRFLYIDGIFISSNSSSISSWNNAKNLIIGASGALGSFMNGSVGKVSVYNRVLFASEVLQNFNATKARYGL